MNLPDLSFFVALERRVWQALADGDANSDAELLDPRFIGVYASGFATRDDHLAQLRNGPCVVTFAIDMPRMLPLAADAALLCYRATFKRPADARDSAPQCMFISSLWKQRGEHWVNIFSQDTAAGEAATFPSGTENA